nr:PH domain-containing protein [uncultured Peptostreptococcus sp.]
MKFKNHPFILMRPLINMGFIVWFILYIIFDVHRNNISINQLWTNIYKYLSFDKLLSLIKNRSLGLVFIFLAIIIIISFVRTFIEWKNSSLNLEYNSLFYSRHGIFMRVHKEVNFRDIANINIRSGLVYNILGISLLTIDINSSATANDLDYKIYLSKKDALFIKDWVLDPSKRVLNLHSENSSEIKVENHENDQNIENYKNDQELENYKNYQELENYKNDQELKNYKNDHDIENHEKERVRPLIEGMQVHTYNFTTKDCIRHILLDIPTFNIALFILFIVIGLVSKRFSVFFLLNLSQVKSIFNMLDNSFNFKVIRYPDHLHIKYGLFNLKDFTLPVSNISSVNCNKSLFARIFGYTKLSVDAIGYGNEENENRLLALYIKDDYLDDFIGRFIPDFNIGQEYSDYTTINIKLIKYYGPLFFLIFFPIFTLIGIPLEKYWISLFSIPLTILACIYKILGRKMKLTTNELIIKKGIFSSHTITIPIQQIDMVSIERNPIYNKLGVYSLTIYKKDPKTGKTIEETGPYPVGIFDNLFNFYIDGEISN